MIEVENLTKYYGDFLALKDANFKLNANSVIGLLGLNGAGKTTTIRMLTGYLIPSNGFISINGINLFDNPIEAKKQIGYLPEKPPLYEDLTVKEYLEFVGRLKNISEADLQKFVDEAVKETELGEVKDSIIGQLSLGYRKRTGIAQAILGTPSFIVMDEPVSGLDPKQIIEMRRLIRKLGEKATVLVSSHILTELYKTCDKFLLIKEGKLVQEFTHDELEKKMSRLSGLEIEIAGGTKEEIENFLNVLEPNIEMEWLRNEDGSAVFKINPIKNEFRELLMKGAANRGYQLVQFKKAEINLEDIFMEGI